MGKTKKGRKQSGGFPTKNFSQLRKHVPTLNLALSRTAGGDKKQRHAVIDTMNNGQMKAVGTLVKSFLNNKIPVNDKALKKLKKDRKYLYGLINKKSTNSNKKKILKQKGGAIIAPILGALLPALVGPIAKLFKR